MIRFNSIGVGRGQIRSFSISTKSSYPLQPLKQRKTTPNKNPRRPHLPDPIETDRNAHRFKLSNHPNTILVIREPSSLPNLIDNLFDPSTINPSSDPDHKTLHSTDSPHPQPIRLSHPILANPIVTNNNFDSAHTLTTNMSPSSSKICYELPPRLREPKIYPNSIKNIDLVKRIQSLRSTHSLTQLSRKFGVSRLFISIITNSDPNPKTSSFEDPTQSIITHSNPNVDSINKLNDSIQIKHNMKSIRKSSRWSVAKSVRRYEKLTRRSMW